MRADQKVTRTKDEARKRAEEIAARAKKGEDFAKLAQQLSDGPTGPNGGDLGSFSKDRMVKPFADAAFELLAGNVSGVVETPFGFHVIMRTE
jgi:parvulin-like peptidyl-prolyl isomerase